MLCNIDRDRSLHLPQMAVPPDDGRTIYIDSLAILNSITNQSDSRDDVSTLARA